MAFRAIIQRLAWITLLALNALAGPEYVLTGTVNFRVQREAQFAVHGYYKYCRQSTYCPTCIRQVYLNVFGKSTCLAGDIRRSDLDCKKKYFSRILTAPITTGRYLIKMEETLALCCCKNNRVSNSGRRVASVIVQEPRPILTHTVLHDAGMLLQNDSVTFTASVSHDTLSGDHAWNVLFVWILPYYAVFLSHELKTNITSPHPGEYRFKIGQIQLAASMEMNFTVQIDAGSKLSVGRHFLSIPTYTVYEQRNASQVFVSSVKPVTVNFTVRERVKGSFLIHPLVDEVYFCNGKTSDLMPSCFVSMDGFHWTGIDPRVKLVSGMIVRGLTTRIFAMSSDDRCHLISADNRIWRCIVLEEWKTESSAKDFVHAVFVPGDLKSQVPQKDYVASKSNGTVSYGGSARGLHRKENGMWKLVALWDCS
ncbi:uncharacterized protein [Montipora foliosa]|uniref:uncharacterized protein n=1 Tax=Montipora foliosa TaxID=591990 RepID=UPI0035F10353